MGADSDLAVWFWKVVSEMPLQERSLLLLFATGTPS